MTPDEFNAKYPVGSEFNCMNVAPEKLTTVTPAYREEVGVTCVVVRSPSGDTYQVFAGALTPVSPPREPNGVRIVFEDGTAREELAERVNDCNGIRWNMYRKGDSCTVHRNRKKTIASIAPCYIEPKKKPEPEPKPEPEFMAVTVKVPRDYSMANGLKFDTLCGYEVLECKPAEEPQ